MFQHIRASFLWLLSLILAAAAIRLLPPSISVSTNVTGREMPVTGVQSSSRQIALTFDAAGDASLLPQLLKILEDHHTAATFFLTGAFADRFPQETLLISQSGHQLGILGDDYTDFTALSPQEISASLKNASDKLFWLTDSRPEFFRPPYGTYSKTMIQTARKQGLTTVTYSIDSMDWKDYGAEAVTDIICSHPRLESGAVICFRVGAKYTPEALELLLGILEKRGYSFVPLSDLLLEENYYLDADGRQIPGEP